MTKRILKGRQTGVQERYIGIVTISKPERQVRKASAHPVRGESHI